MARTTISIPNELKKRMGRAPERVNWSQVAADAFEDKLAELAAKEDLEDEEVSRDARGDNPASLDYVWEKFRAGISILASGNRSIQKRLIDAYQSAIVRVFSSDAPLRVRSELKQLRYQMSHLVSVEAKGGDARVEVNEIEGGRLADKLLALYERIVRIDERDQLRRGKKTR